MFAILGDIPFEVVGSPEGLISTQTFNYAEHRVVQSKPQLQWIADGLETIALEMLLHSSFTDPAVRLFELETAAGLHEALPLVFGDGEFRGFFVITSLATVSQQHSASGQPMAIRVRMSLREWPLALDPNLPPIPGFSPLALVTTGSGQTTAGTSATPVASGVSALLTVGAASGPSSSTVKPGDIPASVITRSTMG